jgi:hypothetical protein
VDPDTILIEGDGLSKQYVTVLICHARFLLSHVHLCRSPRRLLDAISEHQAIEDALYFMDRALSNDEMELVAFLKEVRKLSRQQFMCQALIQKITERQQQLAAPSYHNVQS